MGENYRYAGRIALAATVFFWKRFSSRVTEVRDIVDLSDRGFVALNTGF